MSYSAPTDPLGEYKGPGSKGKEGRERKGVTKGVVEGERVDIAWPDL